MLFQNNTLQQKTIPPQNFDSTENLNFQKNKDENPSSKISLNDKMYQPTYKSETSNKQ